MLLSSCSYYQVSIENMMTPPKLTPEQTQIFDALSSSLNFNKIALVYPMNGDYRSAIIINNIDEEPSNEAIVFYQANKNVTIQNTVRIAILDKINDKWHFVCDVAGEYDGIDRVSFLTTDNSYETKLVVGFYDKQNKTKLMQIYSFNNSMLERIYESEYAIMDVIDIDTDKNDDIFLVNGKQNNYVAKVLSHNGVDFFIKGEANMESTSIDYNSIKKGYLSDLPVALFVDGNRKNQQIGTEILYWQNDQLVNGVFNSKTNLVPQTLRDKNAQARDIKKVEAFCFPQQKPMLGYMDFSELEKLNITNWYTLENQKFVKKFSSFVNYSDSYMVELSDEWINKVSAKKISDQNEVVFFEYLGDISNVKSEIMRIRVINKKISDNEKLSGYVKFANKGQLAFLVKINPNSDSNLVPKIDEVKNLITIL